MTKFYLLRHGVKEEVMGDPHLTERGRKQAELTARFLITHNIQTMYASPLQRAYETAEIVGKQLSIPIITDIRLKERMNWGDKDNETFQEFLDEWEKGSKDRHYQPSHGDSAFNAGERLKNFLLEMGKSHKDKEVLVVTHGGIIGDFLMNIFTNLIVTTSSTGANYVKIFECSLTTLTLDNNEFTLKSVGNISHLPEPLI